MVNWLRRLFFKGIKSTSNDNVSVNCKLVCECQKMLLEWITEGKETKCPHCGRIYKGVYDKESLTIKPVLIKDVDLTEMR